MSEPQFDTLRQRMVVEIAAHNGLVQERTGREGICGRVMAVMGDVPRHEFVPVELKAFAYVNTPLPIGFGKTISQPFIVALMTDLLDVRPQDSVLEIGTGLGYQAAILARMVRQVYSVEIIEELARSAESRFHRLGYRNVAVKRGNGYYGWPEHGPFDKLIVTAAPDLMPPPLLEQLRPGGRMVIPAGLPDAQQLLLVRKDAAGRIESDEILPVRFSALETDDRE